MTKLYDPTASPPRADASLAARLPDLRNKTVGLLDISKAKGNFFLDRVAAVLAEGHAPREIVRRTKPTFARPALDALRNELAERCDVVVEALAD